MLDDLVPWCKFIFSFGGEWFLVRIFLYIKSLTQNSHDVTTIAAVSTTFKLAPDTEMSFLKVHLKVKLLTISFLS